MDRIITDNSKVNIFLLKENELLKKQLETATKLTKMKKEEEIRYRLEKLKQTVKDNKAFLRNEEDITIAEAEEIEEDNYELNTRIKMLEWVLN